MGGELFTVLHKYCFFGSVVVARFYTACVLLALEHLHGSDVVYRDLKSENIFMHGNGFLKLGDMGL